MHLNNVPQRILHIIGSMNKGGAESLLMNVYRNIDKRKWQFDFAVHTDKEGFFDKEITQLGGRLFHLPKPKMGNLLRYRRELKSLIKREGTFFTIHSHVYQFSGVVLEVAKKSGVYNCIAHSHSVMDGEGESILRSSYRWVSRVMIRKNATALVGCSRQTSESLYGSDCWADKRVKVIHNAIEINSFLTGCIDKVNWRKKIGLNNDDFVVGHVGRFNRPKNHVFIIQIFEELFKQYSNSHLILVGDGPERAIVEREVKTKNLEKNVHFLGIRDNINEIMKGFDVFFLPSLYEGLPLVLIEAQAAGLPCIVSNTITKESDIGLEMVKFIPLDSPREIWVDEIIKSKKYDQPPTDRIEEALISNAFDVVSCTNAFEELYARAR